MPFSRISPLSIPSNACDLSSRAQQSLVDQYGAYNAAAPDFLRGKDVADGNQLCLDRVAADTVHLDTITHSCPIDWRTKQPVIINASHQWFINIGAIRDQALARLDDVNVVSSAGKRSNQLVLMLQQRPYWCISRQRVWGVPIPVFYRKDTDQPITSPPIIDHLTALLNDSGSMDFWWQKDVHDLLPAGEAERLGCDIDNIVKGNVCRPLQQSSMERVIKNIIFSTGYFGHLV